MSSFHRRRLTDNTTSGVSVSLVSMLTTVASNFENTWESAGTLTASSVLRGIRVLVVTGTIGLLAVIGIIFGYQFDVEHRLELKEMKSEETKMSRNNENLNEENRRKKLIMDALAKTRVKSSIEERLIEQALPEALHEVSFVPKFIQALKAKHKWLSIVFQYSAYFPACFVCCH